MRFGNTTTGRRSHRGPLGPCTPRPTLTLQPGASALTLTGPLYPGALRTHESLSTLDPKNREEMLSAGLAPGKGQPGARKPSGSDLSLRHRELARSRCRRGSRGCGEGPPTCPHSGCWALQVPALRIRVGSSTLPSRLLSGQNGASPQVNSPGAGQQ